MRVNAPGLTVKDVWDAQTTGYGVAGSYAKLMEDYVDSEISLAKADLTTLETRLSAARALLLDNLDAPLAATVAALLDELAKDHAVAGSFMEFLRWNLGHYYILSEHFEALTTLDMLTPFTETATGGGTVSLGLDNDPSFIRLSSGAVNNDGYHLVTDRTASLAALGGSTLIGEFRARISHESDICFGLGFFNGDVNNDYAEVYLNTAGGAPQPNGDIKSSVDGAPFHTDANLVALLDLTDWHIYRVELTPGTSVLLYVDDVLRATENDPGEVPVDMSYSVDIILIARGAANRDLDVDYFKVWSE